MNIMMNYNREIVIIRSDNLVALGRVRINRKEESVLTFKMSTNEKNQKLETS